jgi:hypothetical protein
MVMQVKAAIFLIITTNNYPNVFMNFFSIFMINLLFTATIWNLVDS